MLRAQNLNLEDINRKRGFEQKIFKDIDGGHKARQNKQYQPVCRGGTTCSVGYLSIKMTIKNHENTHERS
jgi:hypothetical protein